MPLLKRKAFEKYTASEYLRDDDEVFHCEITDEIFKDYEDYCERIILVNSMVWSCEMTGKNNLTYSEALESEKAAKRSLKDFPMELRIPILYLASKTMRCSFAELSEDVFNFVRERYFVGETVEACLEGDTWREAHVLLVTAPKQQPGSTAVLPASSYCYEVEQFHESDASSGQVGTAPYDRVRRRKGVYTRDKNRLFLKQFVERGAAGVIVIKKSTLDKYNINKVKFDQIFTGNTPEFASSKKLIKNSLSPPTSKTPIKPGPPSKTKKPLPEKKGRQVSMDNFVKKTDKIEIPKLKSPSEQHKKDAEAFAEQMRRAGDQMRQRKLEEKERLKEKNARYQAYLKEWQKVKDDLELEDHKIIPIGTPIDLEGISHAHFGDFLSVLEFVHLYAETLKAKDVFHNGLDVDTFRKALTLKEHAGAFSDLVQMMLTTIFSLQDDEEEEYIEGRGILGLNVEQKEGMVGVTKAVELASKACKWSQQHLGTPLRNLPLDPITVSEVLRLHLLSSGAEAGSKCALWRYQQRGGYSSHDDAGLRLRRAHPDLLRRLHTTHVADLSLDDKFKILQCLMNQILSYATVRDIIEEKLETLRTKKHELRMSQVAIRRHDNEQVLLRSKLRKETMAKKEELKVKGDQANTIEEELRVALEKLSKEGDMKKAELEKKVKQLQELCFDYQSFLGSDRGYRRYWLNQCVPGLFVETECESRGPCRDKPVLPAVAAAATEDTLTYVKTLFERDRASSDKENNSAANSRGNSPKKPLTNLNGLTHKLNGLEVNTQLMRDLYVCTGNISTCLVHGKEGRPKWIVYDKEEQINSLIQSLNKRGIRESELRQNLEVDKQFIVDYITKCPMQSLNSTAVPPQPAPSTRQKKFQPSLCVPPDCSLSEALELSVRDYILELEEKIFHGCLGAIKVKDREAWRGTIMLRGYDKQAEYLCWGPHQQYRDNYHTDKTQDKGDADTKPIPEYKYHDPGYYLNDTSKVNGVKMEPSDDTKAAAHQVVRGLASALLQVSQAIHHKYLKRPLGLDDKERKDREAKGKSLDLEALERWEVSLMESRSFAQIVVHLFTLDSSVTWSASILNANCRICRRKTDPDNMLLCDTCNKGHHLYCLKPKLTKVPEGDWFCDQCRPKERTPRKRRKLFSDEDIDEANRDSSEEEGEANWSREDVDLGVCAECGSGGRLGATCRGCGHQWHAECAKPKPSRSNSARWLCRHCLAVPTRELTTRRCAATAINNIHQYVRQLNDSRLTSSDTDDSEDNTALVKLKGRRSRASKEGSPHLNGHVTRGRPKNIRRSKDEAPTGRRSHTSGTSASVVNGFDKSEVKRKRRSRQEVVLHTEALEELLRDVMRHKDSWAFKDPVSTEEVPDYLQVINQPMDFTTISVKLSEGEYSTDEQLMRDSALVFDNCFTYNKDTHYVAKAGVRLQRYFSKRCRELDLPDITPEDHNDNKKRASDQHPPKAKRLKLNKTK